MHKRKTSSKQIHQKIESKPQEKFSPALMEMARREVEAFKERSDESFLIRAEMDRKLTSL